MTAVRHPTGPSEQAATLLELSLGSEREPFQREVLAGLERSIGCACALFLAFDELGGGPAPRASLVVRGLDRAYPELFWSQWATFESELVQVKRFALEQGGVAVDTEVLGPPAREARYYRELVEPAGGGHSLLCYLELRGAPVGVVMLGRERGRAFHEEDLQRMRRLRPALTLGAASYADCRRRAQPTHGDDPVGSMGLTRREQQLVDYVCRGFTNREIGLALGTSPNTVRNQLSKVFGKVGVTTRAELAGLCANR